MKLKNANVTDEDIRGHVLLKFWNNRAFGNRHIYKSDIHKGFPPSLHRRIMENVKDLRRDGFIVEFSHGKEHAFVISPNRFDEIREMLKEKFGIQ